MNVSFLCFIASYLLLLVDSKEECPPFPHAVLENGRIHPLPGQKFSFECDSGYFLASPPQVRCWRGNWTSTKTPKCIRSQNVCEEPPEVPEATIHGDDREVGSVVQYICKPGYMLLGEGSRSCLQGGHWSGITPACIDESEPLQNVAERFKDKFVVDLATHSNDSVVPEARLLDRDSIRKGLELVFLLDRSSSIDPTDFKIGVNFLKFLIQEFGVRNGNNTSGTRAAVITFGTNVDILFNLDNASITGPLAANTALDTVQANGGGTAMEAALTNVFTSLSPLRDGAKKAIFLITDGEPNIGTPGITPEDVAIQLKDPGGFEIFTLGIGKGINRKLLSSLASEPLLSHVFIIDKYSDLKNIMKAITDSPPKPAPIGPERCGYIKDESFYLKKWPWLAAIFVFSANDTLQFCSGTLICSQWIITAASCFRAISVEKAFVVMGEHNLVQEDRHQLNFYAIDAIPHPNFRGGLHNNLALLRLNVPVPLKRFRPACLPPTDKTVPLHIDWRLNASISGWGLPPSHVNSHDVNGATVQFSRIVAPVELAEQQECQRVTGRSYTEQVLCAGFGKNTCVGDMGSPVVALDPSTKLHHVLGVLSKKTNCEKGYNQYTELTAHINWINRVTKKCHLQHWMT